MLRVDHASAPFGGATIHILGKTQSTEINLGVARVATELLPEADRTCEVRGDSKRSVRSERLFSAPGAKDGVLSAVVEKNLRLHRSSTMAWIDRRTFSPVTQLLQKRSESGFVHSPLKPLRPTPRSHPLLHVWEIRASPECLARVRCNRSRYGIERLHPEGHATVQLL